MKKLLLLISCIFLLSSVRTSATHMAGSDISYQHLGGNDYQITYTFYRDCIGIPASGSMLVVFRSFTCGILDNELIDTVPGTGQLISYVCPTAVTTCDGGVVTGIQKWVYTGVITLPANCPDWIISVNACCRNAAITTIVDPNLQNMYIAATLDNTVAPDNNSPVFSNVPIAFECLGQDNHYNHGGLDPDGDSLVYSFVNPLTQANQPLIYQTGYSISNPLTSSPAVNIDMRSGDVFMHPTASEISVIAVKIEEWRNGVLIGSVVRDIQVYTTNCANELPVASGVNGTTSYEYKNCFNGQVCFDIMTSDPDAADSVAVEWNHGIPNATITYDSTEQFPVVHFCWTPTLADVRPNPYYFTLTVHDNVCPLNGVQTFSYAIYLSNVSVAIASTNVSCPGGHNGTASVTLPSASSYQYMWVPGSFTTPNLTHLSSGNYTLDVTGANGCTGTFYVQIQEPQPMTVSVTGINAGCGGTTGSAFAGVSGGTPNYDYTWMPGNLHGDTITNLSTGNYTVLVTDANNCTSSGSVDIQSSTPVTFSIQTTPESCIAQNGSVSVTHTGGSGNFSYHWSNIIDTTVSSQNGLHAGTYTVTAIDNTSGCVQTLTGIILNSSGVGAQITASSNAFCENGEDGSATVLASGGDLPYSYLWSNGDTTATTDHLTPGIQTVQVFDYTGCVSMATVNIGYDHASPQLELGHDTMPCTGSPFNIDAGPNGISYLWMPTGETTQVISPAVSGTYSVLVTDSFGCESFDFINVTFVTCGVAHSSERKLRTPEISIQPNPVHDILEINISDLNESVFRISVTNILGSIMYSSEEKSNRNFSGKIDLSFLKSGIYFIRFEDGKNIRTIRFIKL